MHVPSARRTLALLCVASLGWAVSFGLGAPLASLWLRDAGGSGRSIGLNTSAYYLGVALASPLVPWLMRRGSRGCVLAGMLLDAITTAVFPWCGGWVAWHSIRFLGGVGTALSLIPMETLVNRNAAPQRRARDFGFYAVCVAGGIALGSVAGLAVYPAAPRLAFAAGGLVTLLAVPLAALAVPSRHHHSEERSARDVPWRAGLLSLGTAWAQGFLEGGTITFLSLYLLTLGFSEAGVSGLMGALFAGVVLAQLPVACVADRFGRRRVLLVCHGVVLAGLACVPWLRAALPLASWLFALGACCGALYPLGLALLGERVPPSALARANAWYLAWNCAGSLSGPVLMGLAIDAGGIRAQFAVGTAAVVLVLVLGTVADRKARRQADRQTEQPRAA
jgi:MFS family permease